MTTEKLRATPATVGACGIRKDRTGYWAKWMSAFRGRRVFALADLFSEKDVHVFDAQSREYLGTAKPVVRLAGRMFKQDGKLFVRNVAVA